MEAISVEAISVQSDSLVARDASKRKRVNRSAKLKQFKLDARREQWLAQGVKHVAELSPNSVFQSPKVGDGSSPGDSDAESCVINQDDLFCDGQLGGLCNSNTTVSKSISRSSSKGDTDFVHQVLQAPVVLNPAAVPPGKSKKGKNRKSGRSAKSSKADNSINNNSSSSKGGSSDKSTDVEADQDDDDWEAAADALDCQMNLNKDNSETHGQEIKIAGQQRAEMGTGAGAGKTASKPASAAWKADDTFRPASLPKINKQMNWGAIKMGCSSSESIPIAAAAAGPICCPICTEELDSTESSFQPCSCGFKLCLFCHHRISAEDGRCPGCRKAYKNDHLASMRIARPAAAT